MPTQAPLEPSTLDQMLVRLFLVAELLLNPTPRPAEADSQNDETASKSAQESSAAEADV